MIESYEWGQIRVDGETYRKDLQIYPDGIIPSWWRVEGHELRPEDVPTLAEQRLDHLVVGCGAHGALKVTPAAVALFAELGLGWTALPTPEAVEAYNRRLAAAERVGAVIHLTC